MFVFDNSEDLDIATYEYRIYTEDQVEADPSNPGYYRLDGNVSIDSGTIIPYRQGFNLANVFTISVENSTTTSTTSTTSAVSYYGAIRALDTSTNAGPWTLIKKTSTDTPLIDEEFIGSLTAAKITTGTIGAAEITLNGANSIIKSSNYSAGSLGWKITGLGDAEFNNLVIRTALDIGGSDASSFHVDVDGNLWLGASTYGSAPFRISNTGNVDVGGTDASSFHIDNTGNIWAGAGTFNTSTNPFSVTSAGVLKATGANISGAITATSGTFNGRLQAGDIYIPNTTSPVFSVTTAGAVTASSVTITGGTVGGVSTSNDKLFIGTGNYNNANTAFYVDNTGQFSLKDKLSWNGSALTITGAINASSGSFTGKITVPGTNTQFGTNINDAANYQGIKIGGASGAWLNAWVERSDGSVYFNAQNPSGTNRFYMDSTDSLLRMGNGVFQVTNAGIITATSGTVGGWTLGSSSLSASYNSGGLFSTAGSMTLLNDGTLTSTYVNDTIFGTINTTVKINDYASNGQGSVTVEGNASGSNSKYLYSASGPYNISDSRLKNIINSTVNGLSVIKDINVVKFNYKNDENQKEHIGFIAQQVYEHIPESAFPGGEDEKTHPWMMSKESLIPYLTRSIQELSAKVDELESRLV